MNAPEINLTAEEWPGKAPGLSNGQYLEVFDKNNPGSVFKVYIENGSLHCKLTTPAGEDTTTQTRAVVLAPTPK